MCGICGVVDAGGVDRRDVEAMTAALRHRGPDDDGTRLDAGVGLGHRRLSIIDLAGGHQPMPNEDGSVWITYNGELYNYRELGAALEGRHRFRTSCDTEVILHLYEEKGRDCLRELRGMFAFAIWDARKGELFAARDPFGQKPFYYSLRDDRFAFASEIKALLALDDRLRELDREALVEYLTLRIVTPPRSMFRGIRKLPPGHSLTFREGKLDVAPYWRLRFEPKQRLDVREALDELDRRLTDAVRCHLVSDVPVGAFLSGGVDSSLVLAVMSSLAGEPVPTFTGDLAYGARSELPYARLVARRYGCVSHELSITPDVIGDLASVIGHLDEPSDPLSCCLFALSRFTRPRVKVVLGGDGGDELFAGYDRYYGHGYAGHLARLPRFLREGVLARLLDRMPHGGWYRSLGHRLRWMLQMSRHTGAARYAKSLSYFYVSDGFAEAIYTPELRASIGGFDPEESIRRHFDAADAREAIDRMLGADAATRLPDHPVMILDRMTMAHGLEARSPLLDHELAEFCATLPPRYKIRGTRRRWLQTKLAERYLPREVLTREKQGFSSAFTYMMSRQFAQLYRAFLRPSRLVDEGLLRQEGVDRLLEQHLGGAADHGHRLWLLLNSELWYRMRVAAEGEERVGEQIRAAIGGASPDPRSASIERRRVAGS